MEAAGYSTVGAGLTGTLGGVALLRDRTVRQPATWYDPEQAVRLATAYNRRILGLFHGRVGPPTLQVGPLSVAVAFPW